MSTKREKISIYRQLQADPALGLFKALESMREEFMALHSREIEALRKEFESKLPQNEILKHIQTLRGEDGLDADEDEIVDRVVQAVMSHVKNGHTPTQDELLNLIQPLIPIVQDGHTPTKSELLDLIHPLIPVVENGKTPTTMELENIIRSMIPKSEEIIEKLNSKEEVIEQKTIKGLTKTLKFLERLQKTKTYFHGGGTSSGGGGTVETPTGAVNGSNTSYTVTAEPDWVIADGVTYFAGAGYTYAALTITMDQAPNLYIRAIS